MRLHRHPACHHDRRSPGSGSRPTLLWSPSSLRALQPNKSYPSAVFTRPREQAPRRAMQQATVAVAPSPQPQWLLLLPGAVGASLSWKPQQHRPPKSPSAPSSGTVFILTDQYPSDQDHVLAHRHVRTPTTEASRSQSVTSASRHVRAPNGPGGDWLNATASGRLQFQRS